uniref:Phenylpyryvate decarboxylase isoform I n=1 Tax=Dekkera bruxellensis TaxID=5007 RepID=F8SVL6_DEKBR|nr:phenylpyryvate decarboxylase isoform I [Brettanomyces bruxellensis]
MAPIALSSSKEENRISLSEYVFRRIASLGVHSVFGVPGDFNLEFLDFIYNVPELKWYGTCNELNGAYAADGYSKRSGKLGVLVTTMGVGELSAMNGISGSYAEYVPILSIVGTTPTTAKMQGLPSHHLITQMNPLEKNDHYVYQKMAASISCNVTSIDDPFEAPDMIDNLIRDILKEKKPGYLYIPCNLASVPVSDLNLRTTSGKCFFEKELCCDQVMVQNLAAKILDLIYMSHKPFVLSDCLVDRLRISHEIQEFVDKAKLPNSCTQMGKSTLNEQSSYYIGDYSGDETSIKTMNYVSSCDLMIHMGNFDNETNSGHFSIHKEFDDKKSGKTLIILNHKYIKIGSELFYGYSILDVLPEMLRMLDTSKLPQVPAPCIQNIIPAHKSSTPISETDVLKGIQTLLKPNDTLIVDTGSILYGISDIRLPKGCKVLTQPFYLSIGMGLPCSFGASVANRELGNKGRIILVEGDGAAQMTIQEFSNFNREGLNPLILLLNNEGYTVERAIKGPTRGYNDIRPNWKWTQLFDTFGMNDYKCQRVDTPDELSKTLKEFGSDNSCSRMIEIGLAKLDVPWRINGMVSHKK